MRRFAKEKLIEYLVILFIIGTIMVIVYAMLRNQSPLLPVKPSQFESWKKGKPVMVIDLRETTERLKFPWTKTPSIHFPFTFFLKTGLIPSLDPRMKYILLGSDGNRSRLVATQWAEQGIFIPYLEGGYFAFIPRQ